MHSPNIALSMRQFALFRLRADSFTRALTELDAFEAANLNVIREMGDKRLAIQKWVDSEARELRERHEYLAQLEKRMKSHGSHTAQIMHDLRGAANARTVMRHKLEGLADAAHEPDSDIDLPRFMRALDRANASLKVEHGRMKKAAQVMRELNAEFDRILASIKKRKPSSGLSR
jgi:septal ring factor EnvC (AmiA/AmiB activator)